MKKIFTVGYGKCGTRSLDRFFKRNHLTSVHGGRFMKHWFINENTYKIKKRATCYIYDSIENDFNISFTYRNFPDAYYILPTRSFIKWLVSVIIHFNITSFNAQFISEYIIKRNKHYLNLIETLKHTKNFLIIDIEKDNISEKIINFLPSEYTQSKKEVVKKNETAKHNYNKEKITNFIYDIFEKLGIDKLQAQSPMIIYKNNEPYLSHIDDKNILDLKLDNLLYLS